MPSISQLKYLLAVEKYRHFGKASQSCGVSQPSLSAQIQKYEDQLGFVIFDRSKKPILTTREGLKILEQAKVILKQYKKLGSLASSLKDSVEGEFRLGVIPTLAPYIIPLFLNSFAQKYPNVELIIQEGKTDELTQLLKDDELDAALLVTPLRDPGIIEKHLFFEPFFAYLSLGHSLLEKKQLAQKDLDQKDIWLLEEGHCFREQVLKVCTLAKNQKFRNIEFLSGNFETLKALIKSMGGFTLLPELATYDLSSKEKQVHLRPFGLPKPTREVSLIHSRSFYKESIIEALEAEILDSLPQNIKSLKKANLNILDIK